MRVAAVLAALANLVIVVVWFVGGLYVLGGAIEGAMLGWVFSLDGTLFPDAPPGTPWFNAGAPSSCSLSSQTWHAS